jgi:hypothetical protein
MNQLWATYSVDDHLNPSALATDIVLFDRLVFPVPETEQFGAVPTEEFPHNTGAPLERGPVEWKRNPAEWARWASKGWDPDGQNRLLDLLKPVIRKVPWGRGSAVYDQYDQYRLEAAKLAAQGLPDYAFAATRTFLTRDLPAYVTGVAAIGPSYRNLAEIERDLSIRSAGSQPRLQQDALATVLAWEFFAPDPNDTRLSTEELLKETVAFVTDDKGFQKRRTAFVDWQQKFIRDGMTDRESIERAVAEMRDLLEDANKATAKLAVRKILRYAFRIAPGAVGLGLAVAGIPGGLVGAAGGVFLSLGGIAVDEMVFKAAEHGTPPPTAFVHDARRHFGWK